MVTVRDIAWATIKNHKASFTGVFVAVFLASTLVTALGVLMESGLRGGLAPERYTGAGVVVAGQQTVPVVEDLDPHLSERVRLPADVVDEVADVPGVEEAVGDVSVPLGVAGAGNVPVHGHGWSSAVLTPFELRDGAEPTEPQDVVLDTYLAAAAGVGVGDDIEITHGSQPGTYTVTGTAAATNSDGTRQSSLFFSDERVQALSPDPGQVDTVGVVATSDTDPDKLAERIESSLTGHDVRTYTEDGRADAEFLDVGQARAELVLLAGAFAGTAIMIAMFVVASTLALSVQQRRREFALLRAVGATPRQVRRMVGSETMIVAGLAALLGALPGFGAAYLLKAGFVSAGMIPEDFELALSPGPAVLAIALSLGCARLSGWIAARKPARAKAVEALGSAEVEPAGLSRLRVGLGWVFAALGLVASFLPIVLPGTVAVAGAASSAVFLVVATALLGPALMSAATRIIAAPLRRSRVAGYLAAANTQANSRRMAAAVTPLVLAIAIASVQLFSQSTVSNAAAQQSADGIVADVVVSGTGGIGGDVVESLADADGIGTATPVVRSEVIVSYSELGEPALEPYSAQGITPAGLENTMDLEVRDGDLAGLGDDEVALSQMAADTFGVEVGDRIDVVLGDGTEIRPAVTAIYGRGLGFGDITMHHDVLADHTTTGLTDLVLLSAGGDLASVSDSVDDIAAAFPGLTVTDADGLAAAGQAERDAASWTNIIALLVLLVYMAIAVVNTLVMATAERGRELALLQLVGTTKRQARRMMRVESLIIVVVASVVGTVIAIPPLMGMSLSMTESALPSVPLPLYGVIVGATALLGVLSICVPTRISMRSRPVDAIGAGG